MSINLRQRINIIEKLTVLSVAAVAKYYKINRSTIFRWKKNYDGTTESLKNKTYELTVRHPRAQSDKEIKHIADLIKRNPNIRLNELYGKLRLNYSYSRNPVTLYRYLRKIGYYATNPYIPYVPQKYDTPAEIGVKWQMDVKHIPRECKALRMFGDTKYYPFGIIDEATRERFIYPYLEISSHSTVDFVKRAIAYFGYKPEQLQTDNGPEFAHNNSIKQIHPLDILCRELKIKHLRIRPYTPRHNGKIERSHRSDNERFYKHLKFYSYEDLKTQMKAYLKCSNNIPSSVLSSADGKKKWLTPLEKRKELMLLNWGVIE
ncbi:MAG: DDE-type integrase/transposase/recombinase [Christensenellaceae bacterium]|jgi:transposase|nr:DDE-type integrase/transposase/recombinase [Christensenellaceae bacterium]